MRRHCITIIILLLLSGCNLSSPDQITPSPTPDVPQVEILMPVNNQQVFEDVVFDIDIVARDAVEGISRVALYIDGEFVNDARPLESASVPVFRVTMNWRAAGLGLHPIEVRAYRPTGAESPPFIITLEVVSR